MDQAIKKSYCPEVVSVETHKVLFPDAVVHNVKTLLNGMKIEFTFIDNNRLSYDDVKIYLINKIYNE